MTSVAEGLTSAERPSAGPPPGKLARARSGWPFELAVLAGFLIIAVYATWPLTANMSTQVPGGLIDPLLNVWLFSWGAHAIGNAPLELFNANVFFPETNTFAFTENMLGQSVPVAPIYWLTGNGVLMVNVALLLLFAVGAYGAYFLGREVGATRPAAFVAGIAFGFAPYRLSQVIHPHVLAIHLIPFALALLLRLRRDASRRTIFGLAAVVALQFWSSLSAGMIMLFAVGVFGAWELLIDRRGSWLVLLRAGAGVGLGMLLVVPLMLPYHAARQDHPEYRHSPAEVLTYSATPGSYLSPGPGGPVVRSTYRWLDGVDGTEVGDWEKHLFPGLTLIVAVAGAGAAVGISRRRGRPARDSVPIRIGVSFGLVIAVSSFVLSLGPRTGADPEGFPLPFALVNKLIPGNLLRVPARFGSLVPLGLAVAAGVLITALRPKWRNIAVASVLVASLCELLPSQIWMSEAPRIGAAIRSVSQREGGVLTLPTVELPPDRGAIGLAEREAVNLFLSIGHFRPIVNGYSGFQPTSWWEAMRAVQSFPSDEGLGLMKRRGVETVIVLNETVRGTTWEQTATRLLDWPGVQRVAADTQAQIFDISGARLSPSAASAP